MAIETVRLNPTQNVIAAIWAPLGAKPLWEELAQAAIKEAEAVPNPTTRGAKSTAKNVQEVFFGTEGEAKIPAAAIIKKIVVHWFGKPSAAANTLTIGKPTTGLPEWNESVEAGSTTEGWRSHEVTKANLEKTVAKDLRENVFRVGWSNSKATEARWNVAYVEVEYETTGATTSASIASGAATSATAKRISQPSGLGVTSHIRTAATVARLAQTAATSSAGSSVSVGGVVKTERGAQTAKLTSGAAVAATLARKAKASVALSGGASVTAQSSRIAARAATVASGASVRASAQRVSQPLTRVSGGAVVTATVRRVALVTAAVSSGASIAASSHGHQAIFARVSSGASVSATVVRVGQSEEPLTSTPIAGHVAIGQRGTIGVHRGRLATGNVGRAER